MIAAAGMLLAVTVVVHVVLDVPQPDRHLASYERDLRPLGAVHDRFGLGTWTVGARGTDVAFEPVDHVVVHTRLGAAETVLPPLLVRICTELHQQEVLAEIVGTDDPALGTPARELEVVLPFTATAATIERVHRIFGDEGRSGASQWSDAAGVHVASSVALRAVGRIEAQLRAAGLHWSGRPATIVVAVRAPPVSHDRQGGVQPTCVRPAARATVGPS
jgi:hypothetical protein